MDDNLKDILLVVIGAIASLLGSVITLTLQSRHERRLARQAQRQKHFEEVREYLYATISISAFFVGYLVKKGSGEKPDLKYFQSNTARLQERIINSYFHSVPSKISISKDKKVIDNLNKVYEHFGNVKKLSDVIIKEGQLTKEEAEEIKESHKKMYEMIEYVLDELEKSIYR